MEPLLCLITRKNSPTHHRWECHISYNIFLAFLSLLFLLHRSTNCSSCASYYVQLYTVTFWDRAYKQRNCFCLTQHLVMYDVDHCDKVQFGLVFSQDKFGAFSYNIYILLTPLLSLLKKADMPIWCTCRISYDTFHSNPVTTNRNAYTMHMTHIDF